MPTVYFNDKSKPTKAVKNLGWLIRRARDVKNIFVLRGAGCTSRTEAVLYAYFSDKFFVCEFASQSVCRNWLKRNRSLRGTPVTFFGKKL